MTSQDKEILRQCCSDQLDQISTKDEIFVTEKMNVFTMVSNLIPCFASSSDARGSKFAPSRNFPKKHDKKHVFSLKNAVSELYLLFIQNFRHKTSYYYVINSVKDLPFRQSPYRQI